LLHSHHVRPNLVWLRDDHRLSDHPALEAAARNGAVIVVAIRTNELGGAEAWWWERSVRFFGKALSAHGVPLIRRRGDAPSVLSRLVAETGAAAVYWNRRLDPAQALEENRVCNALGARCVVLDDGGLFAPDAVLAGRDTPYKVFTAFWKRCLSLPEPPLPRAIPVFHETYRGPLPPSDATPIEALWSSGFAEAWSPGEAAARRRFDAFLGRLATYPADRDRPDREGVSRLSPHLRFGEISVREVWHAVHAIALADSVHTAGAQAYLRELGWREFARHLFLRFPDLARHPLDKRFASFPWQCDPSRLDAWQQGKTGYPIVDAGMRQLWKTGWMHNRVRMIVGSFLVKDLLLPWQTGLAWFADTLVDADTASNAMNWQWVAGCGADAAPFFRIFNPVRQSEMFDPSGIYVRSWVDELAALSGRWIHRPWEAPAGELRAAGVRLGQTYPNPMVDHKKARVAALEAFASIKRRP